MREPAKLSETKLKDKPQLSDVAEQHIRETTIFYSVHAQLVALQEWVKQMGKIANK